MMVGKKGSRNGRRQERRVNTAGKYTGGRKEDADTRVPIGGSYQLWQGGWKSKEGGRWRQKE